MPYDSGVLKEILRLKGLVKPSADAGQPQKIDNAAVLRLTGIAGSQLCHHLEGQQPMPPALKKYSDGLELDGNFLLGSGDRFKEMDLPHALAHMALDRYVQGRDVDRDDGEELRYLADTHPDLPMWSKVWRQIHESLKLVKLRQGTAPEAPRAQRPYQSRAVRRRPSRNA